MDGKQFDRWSQRLASATLFSRRLFGTGVMAAVAGVSVGAAVEAKKKRKKKKKKNKETPAPGGCPNGCAFNERCAGNQCVPFCIGGTTPCGVACCLDGAETCQDGVCVQLCADRRAPCGGVCCGDGVACVDGTCGPVCPVGQERCAGRCCEVGTFCVEEVCIPPCLPPRRLCGSVCCQEGEICNIQGQCAAACTGDNCQSYVLDTSWGISGLTGGALSVPCGVALDDDGNLYILECGNDRIVKVNAAGAVQSQWAAPGFGIAVAGNTHVYVANGGLVSKQTTSGVHIGFLSGVSNATDVAVDLDGNVYVLGESAVTVFDEAGTEIDEWSPHPDRSFFVPLGIAIDKSAGDVVVANSGRALIQKFDLEGIPDIYWGGFGECGGAGQTSCSDPLFFEKFSAPAGVAVDAEGNVFVADYNNDRVMVYQFPAAYVTQFGAGELNGPDSVAVDDEGSVFVADARNDRVVKYRLVSERRRQDQSETWRVEHEHEQDSGRKRRKQRRKKQRQGNRGR